MAIPASSFDLRADGPENPRRLSARIGSSQSGKDRAEAALSQGVISEARDYPQ